MKTSPLAPIFNGTVGEQINHQTRAYNLLNQYMTDLLYSISKFRNNLDERQRMDYLKDFRSRNTLTNGKFYDFAVGREMWIEKEPKLYTLIASKIREYSDLENELEEEVDKYLKN